MDGTLHYACPGYEKTVLQCLQKQRISIEFCDVKLVVGPTERVAHRAVLSAASPYFHAMFGSGMVESQKQTVEIRGVLPNVFDILLDFMYSGEIDITDDNCQDVFIAASMLQLPGAVEACTKFFTQQLHASNALGFYLFADTHGSKDLRDTSERYIYSHFVSIAEEDEFKDLPKDNLIYFLHSENLHIEHEFQVLEIAMKWILHHVLHRRKLVFEILSPIRFPIISSSQLACYIENCKDLSLKVVLQKIVKDHKQVRTLTESRVRPHLLVPRKCARKCVYVIGGYSRDEGGRWSDSHSLHTVECYNTYSKDWRTLPPMRYARSGHGVCSLNGLVYAIGGENDSLIFDNAECYDAAQNTWKEIAAMTVPRCGLGVVVVDEEIYAIGGWVGSEIGQTIEKYDTVLNTWTEVGTVQTLRFAMGLLQYEGEIYIIGGMCDQGTELDKVEKYNPVFQEWRTLSNMAVTRAYVGVACLGDFIYAVGGWNEQHGALDTVERYNIKKDMWEFVRPMRYVRAGAGVIAVNGLLYAIGGRKSYPDSTVAPTTRSTVECFDPLTGHWTQISPMPTGRCETGVAVI